MKSRFTISVALLCGLTLAPAFGQWSSDPSKNLALADKVGDDQVQPKLRLIPGGGWYVSWFDSDPLTPPPIGYDPHLQFLDPNGVEQFPHNGLRVANLGNSSTQDWGLDIDRQNRAVLTFLDTREGSNEQVTAVNVGPMGRPVWGKLGVQLTSDSNFHAAPKITGTRDGGAVIAWTSNSDVILQKLDRTGAPQWGTGTTFHESGFNYSVADLHAAEDGTVIVSMVRDQGFGSNRQLRVNKLTSFGSPTWGTLGIFLFDTGSLQFGNFPYFITDGSGGAVFAWYTSSPTLQCFVQHLRADGSEAFPHNGVAVSTNNANVRVDPSASYLGTNDDTFVFWTEEDSLQSKNGVSGQKFDSTGTRQWGANGLTIVPLGSDSQIFVRTVQVDQDPLVFWVDQPSFVSSTIVATKLDGNGATVCPQFTVSSNPMQPFGLVAGVAPTGLSALAWSDSRIGNNGIYVQNVNKDCSLGVRQ